MSNEWISCEVKDSKIIDKAVRTDSITCTELKSICDTVTGVEKIPNLKFGEFETLLNDKSKQLLTDIKNPQIIEESELSWSYDYQNALDLILNKKTYISIVLFLLILYNLPI